MDKKVDRRNFLKQTSKAGLAFMIVPRHVLGGKGFTSPSDKINVAIIGCGGRGGDHVKNAHKSENVVALCDVDDVRASDAFNLCPKANKYKDFRVMLDKEKQLDAVFVATPDHFHAVAAMAAIQLGKHVYVEKPLTHTIYEARMLTEAARKYKVVTQMGNQGSSTEGYRKVQEWIQANVIGDITRVHVWTNRPVWPQGVPTPLGKQEVPSTLDWDLWQGPAKERQYAASYLPFKWRGWWDYGTGSLGDMGCHFIDVPYRALKLTSPVSAEASATQVWSGDFFEADYADSCPPSSMVHLQFPARDEMPPVEMIWYDGGLLPKRPKELLPNEKMGTWDGGIIFEGSRGKMMCDIFGENPTLLPTAEMNFFKAPEETLPRVKGTHQENFFDVIKNGGTTSSPFDYAGPLTESILMGNLAVRCYNYKVLKAGKQPGDWDPYNYPGRVNLLWDAQQMKVLNYDYANQFVKSEYRKGWSL